MHSITNMSIVRYHFPSSLSTKRWQAKPMAIFLPHMLHFIVSRKHVNAGEQSSLIQIVQLALQHTFRNPMCSNNSQYFEKLRQF